MDRERIIRLGIDIGGTFTDVVLEGAGAQVSTKVLTTHSAPEDAILTGLHEVCARAGIAACEITQIIHGTTLATNALIERRGAKTALITTKGFRDVIEMRSESRFEQYDLNLTLPPPLIPRQSRFSVDERMDAKGRVLRPLVCSQVEALADHIVAAGYESVAVGFLHSYVCPDHEERVRDVIARKYPHLMISLSCEVSAQMREYERFNTVVANAYIKPLMKSYLGRLGLRLKQEGCVCPVFLMHSGGGIIALESAAEFPVRLVESGPAGGAVFAADLAARYGLDRVLSFDMGGTTAKICLIKGQTPKTSRVFEVARSYRFKKGSGMPVSIPVIDMVEIGAGGGSLAHVDAMQQIRVGPRSAGSQPGPACYGRGGQEPCVTDADLVLGRLDPDAFAGGSITLDEALARRAVGDTLGAALEMDSTTAAFGLSEVVDENMANAARVHAVENGEDLAQYTMIAFGGAAPLHAGRLCEKLGIKRLLVPCGAGVGSAIGFLRAPFSFEAGRSLYMTLSGFDPAKARAVFDRLQEEAKGFVRSCEAGAQIESRFKIYMRYAGQGWEIPVSVSPTQVANPEAGACLALFEDAYRALFGRIVSGMDVEITHWSVTASTPRAPVAPRPPVKPAGPAQIVSWRNLFEPATGQAGPAAVIERSAMKSGETVAGPAVISEAQTSLIVPASRCVQMQADGTLDMFIKGDP